MAGEETGKTLSLAEQVNSLFEGAEVSDELRTEMTTVVEALVADRLKSERETMQETFEDEVAAEVSARADQLEETVRQYIDYVASEWMKENELAVEAGIGNEISESFVDGLKTLFAEHYVEVPEGKDAMKEAEDKIAGLNEKLSKAVSRVAELTEQVESIETDRIVEAAAEGLTETQKIKFVSLIEGIEYADTEQFSNKVATIRKSFFKKEDTADADAMNEETEEPQGDGKMSRYLSALRG